MNPRGVLNNKQKEGDVRFSIKMGVGKKWGGFSKRGECLECKADILYCNY